MYDVDWVATWNAIAPLVGPVLLAAYVGYRFALRQLTHQKRLEFIEKQVTDFYSPMVGCRKRIRSESRLREELSHGSEAAWQDVCAENPTPFHDHAKHFEPYGRLIDYENEKFKNELLPLYDRMVEIFTSNFWLAEVSTQGHYGELIRFVEIWHRYLKQTLPPRVLEHVEHREERLYPLYVDLEDQLARLRSILAAGGAERRRWPWSRPLLKTELSSEASRPPTLAEGGPVKDSAP
jgi:hypothetical protein